MAATILAWLAMIFICLAAFSQPYSEQKGKKQQQQLFLFSVLHEERGAEWSQRLVRPAWCQQGSHDQQQEAWQAIP